MAAALLLGAVAPAAAHAARLPFDAPEAAPLAVEIVPDVDEQHLRELIDFVLADRTRRGSIASFWATRFPEISDEEFREPTAYHEFEAGISPRNACDPSVEDATDNAFYCALDESISYDPDLLRAMYGRFGDASPVAVLAHEWGHHVQGLAGFPTVDKAAELQADCYAGMYLRHLDDLGALDESDASEALALFHSIGDDRLAPGDARDWFDADVHGDSQERTQAQGIGFSTMDPTYCLLYAGWADRPSTAIVDGVTLRQPPGTLVTMRVDGSLVFETPDATITARFEETGPGVAPEDALEEGLRSMAPEARATAGSATRGLLASRGWAQGDGVRATFERIGPDDSTVHGVAEVQIHPSDVAQLFVSVAEPGDDATRRAGEALDALLWGYCDPSAPQPVTCPSRPEPPVSAPQPDPAATPGATPPSGPRDRPRVTRRELERLLLARMGFASCTSWSTRGQPNDPFRFGARAAVQCGSPATGLNQAAMFIFPDKRSMDRYWRLRVRRVEPPPPRRRTACTTGDRGIRRWSHGELVCYVDRSRRPHRARIRWTDERTSTYGILDATNRSIEDLFRWWSVVAG